MPHLNLSGRLKGEDGHTVITIRITKQLADRLTQIAAATGRSRNALISILLNFALDHCDF